MAKEANIQRDKKRLKLVNKYWKRRSQLKQVIKSAATLSERMEAQAKLAKLPLNSNPVRLTTRCNQCQRPHAVYIKFGLCRICLRQQLMTGNVTGGRKSSW